MNGVSLALLKHPQQGHPNPEACRLQLWVLPGLGSPQIGLQWDSCSPSALGQAEGLQHIKQPGVPDLP